MKRDVYSDKKGQLTRNRPIDLNMYTTNNSASEFIKQSE